MKKDILGALTLWEFPPEDFARWRREFPNTLDSYEEYQMWLSGMERQAEQRGVRGAGAVDDRRNARGTRSGGGSKYARESSGHPRPDRDEATDEWNL